MLQAIWRRHTDIKIDIVRKTCFSGSMVHETWKFYPKPISFYSKDKTHLITHHLVFMTTAIILFWEDSLGCCLSTTKKNYRLKLRTNDIRFLNGYIVHLWIVCTWISMRNGFRWNRNLDWTRTGNVCVMNLGRQYVCFKSPVHFCSACRLSATTNITRL